MAKSITLTALDIGTSSAKLLIGQKELYSPNINILAKEEIPYSVGVRRGEIYDSQKVAENISFLKNKLQKSKGIKIKKVLTNISGPHLFALRSQGLVSVSRADRKISQEDIQRVLQASQSINLPSNKEILEVLPQEFIVDGQGGIKNPLGLEGIRLEDKVLLICVFSLVLEHLEMAILEAGLEIEEEVIPAPLASARAVLSPEQKELGAAVVDIGAGTTSLSVFNEGNLIDFTVFPMGAANITNDIAIGLRTEIATAERIKREFGSFELSSRKRKTKKEKNKKEKIEIPEKELSFSKVFLKNIIESRVSEIFSEVAKDLKRISKKTILPGGVVLTGGGASLSGLVRFGKQKFELPCYLAKVKEITSLEDPAFYNCAGVLLSGFDFQEGKREKIAGEGIKTKFKKIFKIFLP